MTVNNWLEVLTLLGIGIILIVTGISAGWNFVGIIFGLVFAGSSVLGTSQVRDLIHVSYNSLRGRRVSKIAHRDVSDSSVIGGDVHGDVIHGDVIINKVPETRLFPDNIEPEAMKTETNQDGKGPLVDEAVVIQPKEAKEYTLQLKKGQVVTVEASADYPITLELISKTEVLKAERRGSKSPQVEKSRDSVRKGTIEYEAKRNGTWFVHVRNDQKKLPLEVGVIISVE